MIFAVISVVERLRFLRITPVDIKMTDGKGFIEFLKDRLTGKYVKQQDEVEVLLLGHPLRFQVLEAKPKEGKIVIDTELKVEGLKSPRERDHPFRDGHLYWSKRPLVPTHAHEIPRNDRGRKSFSRAKS